MTISVLLADDHNFVREGLRTLLEKETDIDVIALTDNGKVKAARK